MINLKVKNDCKEKWNSYEAHIDSDSSLHSLEGSINIDGVCYGQDELEARHNLKISLLKAISEMYELVNKL